MKKIVGILIFILCSTFLIGINSGDVYAMNNAFSDSKVMIEIEIENNDGKFTLDTKNYRKENIYLDEYVFYLVNNYGGKTLLVADIVEGIVDYELRKICNIEIDITDKIAQRSINNNSKNGNTRIIRYIDGILEIFTTNVNDKLINELLDKVIEIDLTDSSVKSSELLDYLTLESYIKSLNYSTGDASVRYLY